MDNHARDGRVGHPAAGRPNGTATFNRFADLVGLTTEFVGVCDLDRRPLYVNPAGLKLVGLDSLEEAASHLVEDFLFPEDRAIITQWFFDRVMAQGKGEIEIRFRNFKSHKPIWVRYACFVINDDAGNPEAIATISTNITQQRKDAQAARSNREEIQQLADSLPLLIASIDADGCYRWLNARHQDYFGAETEAMIGKAVREVIGEENFAPIAMHFERVLGGEEVEFEAKFAQTSQRPERMVRASYVPQRSATGRVEGFFAMAIDITDRKRVDEELRQALADLSELNNRKDRFLATLAHELRNPLAPLRTGLALLTQDATKMRRNEVLSTMERQLAHVVRLVNDLLDVARISHGKIDLKPEDLDLRDVVSDAAISARPSIDEAGHHLTLDLPDQPVLLHADRARLTQVFANLLDNATKYTPHGGLITVRMAVSEDENGSPGDAEVTVADTGQGIPAKDIRTIFDIFAQVAGSSRTPSAGLGLGLTMVKSFAEMHGGAVTVESDGVGAGTTFKVTLPLRQATPSPASAISPPSAGPTRPTRSLRILIVDDNTAAADLLSELIRAMGHDVSTAYDGAQAIEVANGVKPEVVIMDIGMPVMNGYEAARMMRLQPWATKAMLIALTGWGQDEDRRRATEAGFDRHIVKPIEPEDIERLIRTVANEHSN